MDKINPPKTTPVPSSVIMDQSVPATLLQTYERILTLAWRHDYKYTDWLSLDELRQILGKGQIDRATILRHLADLKARKLIDSATDGKNRYRFSILEVRLSQVAKSQFCDPSSGGGINTPLSQGEPLLPPDKSQNCDLSQKCDLDGVLDPDSYKALRQNGIGETTAIELSNIPTVTPWYIRAMAAQARRDGVNTGALIHRIREQWGAPEWCEHCGELDGQHTETCSCPAQVERRAQEAGRRERLEREEREERDVPVQAPAMSAEMQAANLLWRQALDELRLQLTGSTFDTWLSRTAVVSRDAERGTFVVSAHNAYAKDWLENRLLSKITQTLAPLAGQSVEVRFVVQNEELAEKEESDANTISQG